MEFTSLIAHNGVWYGIVRDCKAISYQFTTTFLQAEIPPNSIGKVVVKLP